MSALSVTPSKGAFAPGSVLSRFNKWVIAGILLAGPLLQAIEFLLENPSDDNSLRVSYWGSHLARTGAGMASGLLAVPFLLGAIVILVALTHAASPRLSWLAGILMTCAMVGLSAAHGYELAAFGLVRSGNAAAAVSVLDGADLGAAGVVLFLLFLGGAVLGTLALALAEWRSPFIPRLVVFFLLAFAVLDFAVGTGLVSHLVALVGNAILAYSLLSGYFRSTRSLPAAIPQRSE